MKPLSRAALWSYGAYALPLALATVPVYVYVPKFYGDTLGLPIALVGAVLLAMRLLDALIDPLVGLWSDRAAARPPFIAAGAALLAIGVVALFNPPQAAGAALAAWLMGAIALTYLGYSLSGIPYLAWGAALSADYHERTRVTATRAGLALAGVLLSAVLPQILINRLGTAAGLAAFGLLFLPVLALAVAWTLHAAPPPVPVTASGRADPFVALRSGAFRWLAAVALLSGLAAAIPATLVLFYVQDVIGRADLAGMFLGAYFIAAFAGMPVWIALSRRLGKRRAWLASMALALVAFAGAFVLGPGDVAPFLIVCLASGLAYGAELALPPALLADIVDESAGARGARPDGAYFGWWQMLEKLALALAAGVSLPLVAALGYVPSAAQPAMGALALVYALVPCVIKLAAAIALAVSPLDRRNPSKKEISHETPACPAG